MTACERCHEGGGCVGGGGGGGGGGGACTDGCIRFFVIFCSLSYTSSFQIADGSVCGHRVGKYNYWRKKQQQEKRRKKQKQQKTGREYHI